MKNDLPNIFEYIDFKKYLADYRKARRNTDPGFTHAYICHKLGQPNARSYFDNVINGRKKVSAAYLDLFTKLLGLDSAETKFFRALVNYNQASSADEKEFYFDQIVQLNRTPVKLLDKNTYSFYKEWYHSTIRAVLGIMDFKDDYKELASKLVPAISVSKAKASIALLARLGLIKPDSRGFLKPSDKMLSTGNAVKDHVLQQYQVQAFELGKNAIVNAEDGSTQTITYTVYVSDTGFKRIVGRMHQFKSEIRAILHKDEEAANRVYQVNLQIFPKSR